VVVSSTESPITKKSKKHVRIQIYDQNETSYLDEEFVFDSASVRAVVVWKQFEKLEIELLEVGNKFAKDSYNESLLKTGPKRLAMLFYDFDSDGNRFKRGER